MARNVCISWLNFLDPAGGSKSTSVFFCNAQSVYSKGRVINVVVQLQLQCPRPNLNSRFTTHSTRVARDETAETQTAMQLTSAGLGKWLRGKKLDPGAPKSPWPSGSVAGGIGLKQRPRSGSRISSGFCICWTFLYITNHQLYCLSNALHSSIGQNIKSHTVSVIRCPFPGQSVKNFKWP